MFVELYEAGLSEIARATARDLRPGDVIFLYGDLGTGKTTFARALLHELGEQGEVPSPSFAIVQPYGPPAIPFPVAHVDLYRVEKANEVMELGLDDFLYDGALLIEWPERLPEGSYPEALRLSIERTGPALRRLTAEVPSSWRGRWTTP